jgi:integrase
VDFKAERIRVPIQKTDEYLTIPFLSDVGKYLQKLKKGEIKIISETKYNQFLKSLFERIGIVRECHIITQLKNQKIIEVKPFFEIVSSHTARRSFVTLSYQMGLSREEIRMIGGWSDEKEMKPYLNIVEEDAFNNAKKVWG